MEQGPPLSSATAARRALQPVAREATKVRKYRPICERIGAQFRPAAIERHGHCGDGMCSVIKLLSGDGERNLAEDDISFTAPSKTTFVSQHLVFAAVMADAAMVCKFVLMAAHGWRI